MENHDEERKIDEVLFLSTKSYPWTVPKAASW